MKVVTTGIGNLILDELKNAVEVQLAVAFFSPNAALMTALCSVPRLSIVISEEFTINNPYTIEKLPPSTVLRSVPTDSDDGKLHAKVMIVTRNDGTQWAILGSANMTYSGLFENQEACVSMESTDDMEPLKQLSSWFRKLLRSAGVPDLSQAKQIFESTSLYRLDLRPVKTESSEVRYWAIKTTRGKGGRSTWPQFLADKVVAIGWHRIDVIDPSKVSDAALSEAISKAHPTEKDRLPHAALKTFRDFIEMKENDLVVICKGYGHDDAPVHIFGLARVTGPFRADPPDGEKWRFKHDAIIQRVERNIERASVANTIGGGKGSLIGTLHELQQKDFERFLDVLRMEGIPVHV